MTSSLNTGFINFSQDFYEADYTNTEYYKSVKVIFIGLGFTYKEEIALSFKSRTYSSFFNSMSY